MQLHLVKGRAEMQKQTVEAAEGAVAGLKADLAPAEGDRQHFVNHLPTPCTFFSVKVHLRGVCVVGRR